MYSHTLLYESHDNVRIWCAYKYMVIGNLNLQRHGIVTMMRRTQRTSYKGQSAECECEQDMTRRGGLTQGRSSSAIWRLARYDIIQGRVSHRRSPYRVQVHVGRWVGRSEGVSFQLGTYLLQTPTPKCHRAEGGTISAYCSGSGCGECESVAKTHGERGLCSRCRPAPTNGHVAWLLPRGSTGAGVLGPVSCVRWELAGAGVR